VVDILSQEKALGQLFIRNSNGLGIYGDFYEEDGRRPDVAKATKL
jgi:hypothetical protein